MKRIFTKTVGFIMMLGVFATMAVPAGAQYIKKVYENNNEFYTAVAKDAAGNIYAVRTSDGVHLSVVKYAPNSTTFTAIFNGLAVGQPLDSGGGFSAWGLAINSHGDVYVTTNLSPGNTTNGTNLVNGVALSNHGNVIKLASNNGFNGTVYTASVYLSGGLFYAGLAFDSNDNLYVMQSDDKNLSHSVVEEYAPNSTTGTILFNNLNDDFSDNYPHGIAVAPNLDIFVANSGEIDSEIGQSGTTWHKGDVRHYTKSSNYASFSYVSTNTYPMAVALDPSGNLYVSETDGSTYSNYRLNKYNSTTHALITGGIVAFDIGSGVLPDGIAAVSNGDIYVTDGGNPGQFWELIGPAITQASNITFGSTGTTSTTINWTKGDGANRAVFMAATSAGTPTVSNSTNYTANSNFSSGSTAGSGWYCVYNGTGNSVNVTGLSPGTAYRAMIVEYNGSTNLTDENYSTTSASNNPNNVTTLAPVAINSLTRTGSSPTNASQVSFTATFGGAVIGLTTSNFSLTTSGVSGAGIASVSGSGTTWTVTVNTGSGDGTIQLNLANATGLSPGITTSLPFSGQSYTIDKTAPIISIGAPSATTIITGKDSVSYTVTYTDANFNSSTLASANVTLNTTGNATGAIHVKGTGTTRTVTISSITGSGSISINIAAGTATDNAGNTAPSAGPSTTFAVTLISQHITFNAIPTKTYGNADFAPGATSDNNGIAIAYSSSNTGVAIIVSGNVHIVGAGTATITASQAGDATHSAAGNVTQLLTVNQAPLTITANNQSMTYGGTLPTLTASYTGFVNGDNSASLTTQPSLSTTATASSHVSGSPYTIIASGAVDANYAISYVAGSITIGAAPLTITANNQSMTYGGTLPTLTASYTGFVNGDNSASLTAQPSLSTPATASSHVAGGPYPITASGAADADYAISYVAGTLTIGQAPLTITANNQSMTYGGTLPTLTASYTGFVNGDNSASQTTQPTINTTATSSSHVAGSPYTITASGAADADYAISYVAGTLTIGQAPLTITADNQTMTYGGTVPTLTASYTGFVNGDNSASLAAQPTLTTTATASSHAAGSPYTITASGAADADYSISYVAGTLTIGQAPLTITADNQTMTYGGTLPTLTASYSGFVNGDNSASLATQPTLATTATASSHPAGSPYPITASGATDADYSISYVAGTLTIGQAPLTITADNQTMTYGGTLPTLTASYSGFVNGDNSASLATQPTLNTTATSSSHAIGSPYAITASGAADADYSISYVAGTLTIGQAPLTITADNQTMTYGGTMPTLTASYAGFVNGDDASSLTTLPTFNSTATASSNVGAYPVTPGAAVDGDYNIAYAAGTLTIGQAPLTIAADNQTAVNGHPIPTLTASYTGFVNGDTSGSLTTLPTISTTGTSSSADGTYPITVTGAADPNYNISYIPGTLTIAPSSDAALANLSISNGALSPVFASSVTGYADTVSNATTSVTVTPVTDDVTATIKVNGTAVTSGSASASIPLAVGANSITTVVTAQDSTTTRTYTVTVARVGPGSSVATLSSLAISHGALSPAFATATTDYTATVNNATLSVTVTPRVSNAHATVKVNGTTVTSGTASASLPLAVGINVITTAVTAQDGVTTTTYTVTITRLSNNADLSNLTISNGTLSPAFTAENTAYADTVSNATAAIAITPTASDAGAIITVNNITVASGAASASVSLAVGNTTLNIVVTAQDGITRKKYTVVVTRLSNNPYLSNLTLSSGTLSPVFAITNGNYTSSVSSATTSLTVTPALNNPYGSIKVNGVAVVSGTASAAIPLVTGANIITTTVTAQDGVTHKTYKVTITRPSNNAYLANLTLSSGGMSPAFNINTNSYTASVSNGTASVTVTPTVNNPNSSVKVNGITVSSGTASAAIPLNVGANTISTLVTAQDGITHKTYTITITRAASGLNSLYLPGNGGQTAMVTSLNEKVEANNILSPNGDGINDIWVVKNIAFYPDNTVTVYNKTGQVIFTKKGYTNDWDGTYRGSVLNEGTYYYRVDLGNGSSVKGFITVVNH